MLESMVLGRVMLGQVTLSLFLLVRWLKRCPILFCQDISRNLLAKTIKLALKPRTV